MRALLGALLVCVLFAASVTAQITNGDFTSGLTGWTTSTSGLVTVGAHSIGNPSFGAHIGAESNAPQFPEGSGSISQSFFCGSSLQSGPCVVSFQYLFAPYFCTAQLQVFVDGNEMYSAVHSSAYNWATHNFSVGCGAHTIEFRASYVSGFASTDWRFYFDNVAATCDSPLPVEESTWGRIKALYR
jgi:hypothetical protein